MRKVLIGGVALVAVGGAFYLGTMTRPAPVPPPESAPQPAEARTALVDNLIVPTGLTLPETLPEMKIDNPAKVLAGEVKIPTDLLRKEPPAAGHFVVPELPK